jgi:1,2-diacylglycerol 3-alpha-glucosyltransferase
MKIAIFTDSFYPGKNGVTTSILNFCQELSKRNHKIFICAPSAKDKQVFVNDSNIHIEWLPSVKSLVYPDLRLGALTPRSLLKLRQFKPDIIHVQTPLFIGGEGILAAWHLKKPLIYTFHTFSGDSQGLKIFRINRPIRLIEDSLWNFEKRFCKSADIVICPTNFVKKALQKHGFKNQLKVIPTGIKIDRSQICLKNKNNLKREYNLKGKIILGVGRLGREKNWEFLLAAFSYLHKIDKNYTLALIGGGPAEKKLRLLSEILKVNHHVRFLGEIKHHHLINKAIYQVGDIFTMPSEFETQGMVTLEAMMFGLPIVAVRSKGSAELVDKYGLLVSAKEKDFGETMLKILKGKKLQEKYRQKSLQRAQQYSIDKTTDLLEKTYQSLIKA